MTEIASPTDGQSQGSVVPLVTLDTIRTSHEIRCYLQAADQQAILKGYTEHGLRHASLVSSVTHGILVQLQVPARRAELGAIAGYMHDLGILVGREGHAASSGLMAMGLLQRLSMPPEEIVTVVTAVANHDEVEGVPVSDVGAALILADKSDVHRGRVRNPNPADFDHHDRVNFAARRSFVRVQPQRRAIVLDLTIDNEALPGGVLDYFEIFLPRMLMARRAAEFLGCQFELHINNNRVA